jgi:hypothetical protein
MFEIRARSRYLDLTGSIRLYYLIAAGIFISLFSFLLYRDLLITLSMVVTSGVVYYLLALPPKDIVVTFSDSDIVIADATISTDDCKSWGMVNLDTMIEFVINTTKYDHPFYYFYISLNDPRLKMCISTLAELVPFDEKISQSNKIHLLLREFGLK